MTFREKYLSVTTWYGKCQVMEIYHLTMTVRENNWTILKTSEYFDCSIGLVSENLRLAQSIHFDPSLVKLESRQDALKRIKR